MVNVLGLCINNSLVQLKKVFRYLLPILLGCLLIPVPLLGDFHFESAMIAAIVGCFWGGILSSRSILKKDSQIIFRVLSYLYLFGLPLLVFSVITSCLSVNGVVLWILVPIPSVLFGVAIGRFFRRVMVPVPMIFTILTILFISLGVLVIEFLTLPQVYYYNHVWGHWPGPIYDETVQISTSLLFFRGITLLWVLLLWFLPDWKKSISTKIISASAIAGLCFGYVFLAEFGIVSPRNDLQQELSFHYETDHFRLYADEGFFSEEELEYWALKHEFFFDQIVNQLEISWPEGRMIESYLYANAWQKKELVGAKFTSYVPIWLEQDQLHIAKQHLNNVLLHELVHVVSKQFGNDLFNGSWSIGLIEGLAEAIAKDASSESTLDQIMAAKNNYPTAEKMKSALSFFGFYADAGAISYATSGSFVKYLLENYPVSSFKQAYASSSFETSYSVPFEELVSGWHASLPILEVDSVDQQTSNRIFSQQSIFQRACPHSLTEIQQLWDDLQYYRVTEQKEPEDITLRALINLNSDNLIIKREWVRNRLESMDFETVETSVSNDEEDPILQIFKADALALQGRWNEAFEQLSVVQELLPNPMPRNFTYSFDARSDSLSWKAFVDSRYNDVFSTPTNIGTLASNTLSLNELLIEQDFNEQISGYANSLIVRDKLEDWFDIYVLLIDQLIYMKEFDLAAQWIAEVEALELRPRYRERLSEQQQWLDFVIAR